MRKKFSMLALIVLLVFQTMLTPIAATAQGLEVQGNNDPNVAEDVNVGEADDLEEDEGSENGETDVDGEESGGGDTSEGEDITNEGTPEKEPELDEPVDDDDPVEEPESTDEGNSDQDTDLVGEEQDDFSIQSSDDVMAVDSDREPGLIEENIIDAVKLMREDGTEYKEGDLLDPDEKLSLALEWSLPEDPVYIAGDTFEFQLPEQLAIYNELDGGLDEFGTYYIDTDGNVTFTFNEEIENNSNVWGTFWVNTELDLQEIETTTEELEFVLSDGEVEKITIQIKPENGQAIQKNVQPVGGNFNTKEIEWTVVINTTRESLENAILNDPILAGQVLDRDSIVVKEVEVSLQGGVVGVVDGDVDYTDESSEGELKLNFGDTNKAYQITFRTKMKEEEEDKEGSTTYHNTAYLNSDGKPQADNGASVSVNRPKSLEKTSSAFAKGDRSVEWEVKANFTEKELSAGTEIVDEFTFTIGEDDRSDAFEITLDDIEILQVDSFDNNGEVDATSNAKDHFDISIDGNKVTYTLEEASNKAYVIKYKTTAKDGAYINDDGTISNTVGIDGNTATSSQGVGQQVGVKTNDGINYEDKTIDWEITVNADSQELKNFILKDDFSGSGQKLVGSIEIEPQDSGATINLNPDDIPSGEGFIIEFGTIDKPYTIKYTTEFTYNFGDTADKPRFNNGVHVSYTTTEDEPYELEFGDNVNPNPQTKSNGAKNNTVNQETKEITWFIDINYNQLELDDAKLIDVIEENQTLVEESVKVYPTTIDSDGKVTANDNEATNFELNIIENDDGYEQINIDFEPINESYRVVFITKDKDGIYNEGEEYNNTAQFIPRADEVHNLTSNATLPNQGEFLGKSGLHNRENWTIDWEIIVNNSKSKLNGVTVTDDLGDDGSQILLEDSIVITKVGSDDPLPEEAYTVNVDENTFEVTILGEITDTYSIKYSSYILAQETANITNEAEIKTIEEIIQDSVETIETVEVRISSGGGTAEGATGELVLQKLETDTDRPLEGVAFTLTREVLGQTIVVREGTTDENGEIHWTGLKYATYTLEEDIPQGYLGEASQKITINDTTTVDGVLTLQEEIANEREKGTAAIEKVDSVTGEGLEGAVFKITNLVTGQTYELTTGQDGKDSKEVPFGEFKVEEITAPNGYRSIADIENITIEIDETTEVTIENEASVNVDGEKTWVTSEDEESLDSITVELLTNGTKTDEQEVSASDDWKYSFTDLDKYDEAGEEIEYTIAEVEVDGYNTHQDGYDLTNIETTEVSVTKTWLDDGSADRPDQITVILLADGEKVEQTEVTAENGWEYKFTDLDKFDEAGEEIVYTIEEIEIAGYEADINGFDITNTRVGTISVKGEKTWLDEDPTDRPKSITVNLSREVDEEIDEDFVESKTVEPNNKGEWTYEFNDLAEFDENGAAYTYKVEEADVPENYESNVEGYDITNVRIGETEVSGTKRWKDDKTEDRPEEITINLLRNNVVIDTKEVTADDNWKYTFTGLAEYDDEGKYYNYTVKEQDVEGYNSEVKGTDITNTRAEKKDIEVSKAWLDDESEERPESIVVYLKQNGANFDTVELKAENDWKYEFTDLEAFDENGHAYSYSVEEKPVVGYETTIDGFDITNLRVGETEVSGTKTWLDDDSENRPEEITVTLLANGEETDQTVTVDADSDWTYEFTELDQYDDQGKEITYTVDEAEVEGYEKSFAGNDITNLRVGKTEVTGEKDWVEVDERYRPDSITVQLLANGEEEDTIEVSAETDWSYGFTGLEKYDDQGKEITYTVEELDVPAGYTSKVDGYTITNTQESTQVTGEKVWEEVNSEYRPDSITVQLLANGEEEKTVEVSSETDWTYEFANLAKYDKDGEEITYTVDELDVPAGYDSEVDEYTITNTQISISVSGEKTWNEVDDRYRPDSITVQLLANGEEEATIEVSAETDWAYAFTNLAQYDKSGEEITYTVKEVGIPTGYESEVDGFNITNTQEATKVSGEKNWDEVDSQYRPDSITVQLLANGEEEETVEVSNETDWTYEFTDLAKYDKDGKEIDYTVEELDVPAGYESEVDGYTITNTQASTEVKGEKIWKEVDSAYRPDLITVQLLANDKEAGTIEVTEETDWKYSFTDLAKYDKTGEEIEYTVEEVDGPANYNVKVDGYNITNTQKTYAIGDYTWIDRNKDGIQDDNEEVLEGVKVELFDKDGNKLSETETDEDGLYIFDELPAGDYKVKFTLTKEQQEKYKFTKQNAGDDTTVDSDADPDTGWTKEFRLDDDNEHLTKEYDNQEVKATEGIDPTWDAGVIELVHISGTKTWLDNDSTDRPEEITVYLVANDEETDKAVTVDADSDWQYAFNNLDKYDSQGEEITYTVNEKEVDGYEPIIEGFDITNLRVGEIEVEIIKSWNDENETDRPETIKVNLLQNGDFYEEYEVTKESDWKLTIKDLPQYDEAGKAYEYTITEHDVAGYAAEVNGFEITNTRTGEKSIEISKSWLDTEETANRPDEIEVDLFRSIADGDKELVETYTVTANDDWSLEITELPTFDKDGKAYTYEIEEKAVEGYETTINGFNITNLRVGETKVEGTKTWLDDNSEDRPETITVQLFANGEETDKTAEVTAETEWKYEFTGLDKYDNQGIEIIYTIDEVEVPEGYEKSIEGNDITNVKVGTTEVSGEKSWVEVDEQYRPDSITVNLLANGEELHSTTASAETDWKFTFTDLAKYDAEGKEIEYTIEEVEVPGYVSEVDGYNITNTQETTNIIGMKTWIDDSEKDRPESITVQVMNGDEVVQEQEVTAEDNWIFTFTDLAKYDSEGNEIEYTINELPVPGYATEIDGFDITNTLVPVEEPEDPELSGDGGEIDPEDPTDLGGAGGEGDNLPSTATNIYNLALIGFGLMLLGLIIFLTRRKRIE